MYEDLALARFLGVIDGIKRIVQDAGLHHSCGVMSALELNRKGAEN